MSCFCVQNIRVMESTPEFSRLCRLAAKNCLRLLEGWAKFHPGPPYTSPCFNAEFFLRIDLTSFRLGRKEARMRRRHLGPVALASLLSVLITSLSALMYASPPDPSWIRGVYDD